MTPVLSTETRMRSITKEGESQISAMLDDACENLTVTATFDGVWRYGNDSISSYQTISGTYYVVVYFDQAVAKIITSPKYEHSVPMPLVDQIFLLYVNYDYKQKEDTSIPADGLDPVIKFYLGQTEYETLINGARLVRVSNDQIKKLAPIEELRLHIKSKEPDSEYHDIDKAINDLKIAIKINKSTTFSSLQTLNQEGWRALKDIASSIHKDLLKKTHHFPPEIVDPVIEADFFEPYYYSELNKPFTTTRVAASELPNMETFQATLRLSSNNLGLSRKTETFAGDGDTRKLRISDTVPTGTHTDIQATLTISVPETPGGTDYKVWKQYDLPLEIVSDAEDIVSTISIRHNAKKVQYLDLDDNQAGNKVVRANTLIAKEIAQRVSTRSYGDVIASMGTELAEPPVTATGTGTGTGTNEAFDFGGTNGLYFWEMFFHVPFLVARHLSDIGNYDQAWAWCRDHLFDPFHPEVSKRTNRAFWKALPLAKPGARLRDAPTDAEGAGYWDETVFKKAVHFFLVDLWRRQGDDLFRQLTRESVREAGLCYRRAQALIGLPGEPFDLPPWKPSTLAESTATFFPPYNVILQDEALLIQQRLDNLRRGRTIDGALAPLLTYEQDDSTALMGGRPGVDPGRRRGMSSILLTHHRYDTIMPAVRQSVAQCIDMGRYLVETHRLSRSHASALLRHRTLVRMSEFDIDIKRLLLSTAQAEKQTLLSGRDSIKSQLEELDPPKAEIVNDLETIEKTFKRVQRTYAGAIDVGNAYTSARNNRNEAREKQVASHIKSNRVKDDHIKILKDRRTYVRNQKSGAATRAEALKLASSPFVTISNALRALPNLVGIANGGHDWGATTQTISDGFDIASKAFEIKTLILDYKEEETAQEVATKLKVAELKQQKATFDLQLAEQDIRIESAQLEVQRAKSFLDGARQQLASHQDDETKFQWSLDRLSQLYASIFQSTMNLCLLAEASLHIEMGSPDKLFIPRNAWSNRHHDWHAGEALHNGILAMDAARLSPSVRPLRITKRISLKTLGNKSIKDQLCKGNMSFDLQSKIFDEDFPGHYFRRIRFVKASIQKKEPSNTDETSANNIDAVLTQVSNTILTNEDMDAIAWLYKPTPNKPDALCDGIRLGQQIAISQLTTDPDTSLRETLAIHADTEGQYDYFEYTGAISSWTLQFICDEAQWKPWLARIEDIVLEITYESFAGSESFSEKAKHLLKGGRKSESSPSSPGHPGLSGGISNELESHGGDAGSTNENIFTPPPPITLLPVPDLRVAAMENFDITRLRVIEIYEAWAELYARFDGDSNAARSTAIKEMSRFYVQGGVDDIRNTMPYRFEKFFRPRPRITKYVVSGVGDGVGAGVFHFTIEGFFKPKNAMEETPFKDKISSYSPKGIAQVYRHLVPDD